MLACRSVSAIDTKYLRDWEEAAAHTKNTCSLEDMLKVSRKKTYCWSHGHHPVGAKHTSIACTNKKEGHQDAATATNRMGGDNFWPRTNKVGSSQQGHASYKEGKSALN